MNQWIQRAGWVSIFLVAFLAASCSDTTPTEADAQTVIDTDNDGIPNISDPDIDGDGIANASDPDIDGDGIANTQDPDIDGDGIANIDDNDIDGDGVVNTQDPDIDGDGIPNASDPDIDGDGITNGNDADIDGDGIPNSQDIDIDGDGIPNASDPVPDGTGDGSSGTQGPVNSGNDVNSGQNNGNSGTVQGLVIEAADEMSIDLQIASAAAGVKTTESQVVDLQDVRDEITGNDIDLPTAYIKDIEIKSSASSAGYIATNGSVRYVLRIYFQQVGQPATRKLIAQTPDETAVFPIATVGDLASGVSLNDGLYVVMPGYEDYVATVKDESKAQIEMVAELEQLDALSGTGTLGLTITTIVAGKMAL